MLLLRFLSLFDMAFYREYELCKNTLIKYFYMNEKDRNPALIIRIDVDSLSFSVRNHRISPTIVVDEVRCLLELMESPHWRSFVACCSTRESRKRCYDLF